MVRFIFWKDHLGHCVENILERDQRDGPGTKEVVTIFQVRDVSVWTCVVLTEARQ